MTEINYIVWYKTCQNTYRIFESKTRTFKNIDSIKSLNINQFEFNLKSCKANDENLIIYCDLIKKERDEIYNSNVLTTKFDYFDNSLKIDGEIFYRNHYNNIATFLKKCMSAVKVNYKSFENKTSIEEALYSK